MQSDIQLLIQKAYPLVSTDPKAAIKLLRDLSHPTARAVLAHAYMNDQQFDKAIDIFKDLVASNPENPEFINHLGSAFQRTGRFDEAEEVYLSVLSKVENAVAYSNLGNVYRRQGRYSEAIAAYKKSLKISHSDVTVINLSGTYLESRQPRKAIRFLKSAKSPHIGVDIDLAMAYLTIREWELAAKHFKKRFEYFPAAKAIRVFYPEETEWNGEVVDTVSVYCEQGAGDFIQFLRYHKVLTDRYPNTKFLWNGDASFKSLLESQGIHPGSATDPCDAHCSVFDLPNLLKLYPGPSGAYLRVKPARYENYEGQLKVGIVWGGNAVHGRDLHRSVYLRNFKALADIPNVKLFSLQKDYRSRLWLGQGIVDLTEGARDMPIIGMHTYMTDWHATARLVAGLDVVISVDTSILHLSGALGKPTLALIPWSPDWRWGLSGKKCEIYDSVKMFRQKKFGEWQPAADEIIKTIRKISTKYV